MSVALWRVWFYTPTFDCWQCNPVSPSFSAVGCTKTPRHQSAPTAIRRALLNESPMAECDGRTLLFVARQERRQVDLLAATAFGYFCVHFCSPSPRTSHPPSVRRTPLESIGSIDPGGPSLAGQATSVLEVSRRRWNGASVCSQTGLESPPLPVHCDSAFPPKSVRKRAACRIGPASSLEQEGKGGGLKEGTVLRARQYAELSPYPSQHFPPRTVSESGFLFLVFSLLFPRNRELVGLRCRNRDYENLRDQGNDRACREQKMTVPQSATLRVTNEKSPLKRNKKWPFRSLGEMG